jgi:hypothetical protein
MRGKWALATAAVVALVVVGGIGGLTVRAFAGVSHTKVVTKNVTRFCVYVDRHNPGDSYGDVTVIPKYKNRICIVGKRGAAGDSSVITWNKTVAEAPAPPSARHVKSGFSGNTVDLAKVGPFTVRGYCASSEGVEAYTNVLSAQDGSSFAWDDNEQAGSFNNGDNERASNYAEGSAQDPSFVTEYENGEFAVSTNDQKTAFTGFSSNGVYIQGADGPACSFTGYLVVEKLNPSS